MDRQVRLLQKGRVTEALNALVLGPAAITLMSVYSLDETIVDTVRIEPVFVCLDGSIWIVGGLIGVRFCL